MRELRLVFGRSGQLITLVCAALAPACGGSSSGGPGPSLAGAAGTAATGGAGVSGGSGGGSGGMSGGSGGSAGSNAVGGTGGVDQDYPYDVGDNPAVCDFPSEEYVVALPDEGVPPNIDDICAAVGDPAESGWAARIELEPSTDRMSWTGAITFAPGVTAPSTPPEVSVVSLEGLADQPDVSVTARPGGGWQVTLTWPSAIYMSFQPAQLVLAIEFEAACAPRQKSVRAQTVLHLCGNDMAPQWVSSGDECSVCATICEMAPSPAFSAASPDALPLRDPIRARLRVVGRAGRALVLLAEHDGGADQWRYSWQVGSGTLLYAERDVAVWLPADSADAQLAQVGVDGRTGAAVASLRWGRAA